MFVKLASLRPALFVSNPVLLDRKGPCKFKVAGSIVVHESALDVICASSKHAAGGFFRQELFLIGSFLRAIGSQHLLGLVHLDALSLDYVEVLEARDDIAVDSEFDLESVFDTFLDHNDLVLERLNSGWSKYREIGDNLSGRKAGNAFKNRNN